MFSLPSSLLAASGTSGRGVYDLFVGLHVVCAVVGFGAVAITGAYGAIGRKPARVGADEETNRYFASPNRAEYLLVVAPVFGIVAMALRPGGSEFGQAWAIVGYLVWAAASTLLLAVVRPAEARIRSARTTADPSVAEASSRLMWAAATCDLLFVVALMTMVVQPG